MNVAERVHLQQTMFGVRDPSGAFALDKHGDEMLGLAHYSSGHEWLADAGLRIPAKPIGQQQWKEAFLLVMMLDRIIPALPAPTPGADPRGFICLTWRTREGVEFALELHADLTRMPYTWTVIKDGFEKTLSAPHGPRVGGVPFPPRALIESLRDAFGETEKARATLAMVETHGA